MSEENYFVKVMVDGKAVADGNLCGGSPTSSNCRYRVSGSINKIPGNSDYFKAKEVLRVTC